ILRDGVSFLICETVLVAFLFKSQLSWHLAVVLISLYMAYLAWLATDALRYRKARRAVVQRHRDQDDWTDDELRESLIAARIKPTPNLMERIGKELRESDSEESDDHESAGLLFNRFEVSLSGKTAIGLLIVSTMITAVACYWLVELTLAIADSLGAPVFFVAVIVAAAASSVPDTFLSIAAARRGDDDGAVSNAFGSNIFDICICLSIPLLAALWISGGEPITLQINGEQIPGLFGLQVLLLTLSVITLGILIHRLELTRAKSIVLVALYLFFIGYAVVGSIAS
ncbi:MAG: sodium/calcium exchanger protein, partial [Planctomycetota bacterium]